MTIEKHENSEMARNLEKEFHIFAFFAIIICNKENQIFKKSSWLGKDVYILAGFNSILTKIIFSNIVEIIKKKMYFRERFF